MEYRSPEKTIKEVKWNDISPSFTAIITYNVRAELFC